MNKSINLLVSRFGLTHKLFFATYKSSVFIQYNFICVSLTKLRFSSEIVTIMCSRLVIIHYKMQFVIFACMFLFTSFRTHIYLCCAIKYSLKVELFPLNFSPKISFELNICNTNLLTKCICSKIPKKMKIKIFLNLCKHFFPNSRKGNSMHLKFHDFTPHYGSPKWITISTWIYQINNVTTRVEINDYWTNH